MIVPKAKRWVAPNRTMPKTMRNALTLRAPILLPACVKRMEPKVHNIDVPTPAISPMMCGAIIPSLNDPNTEVRIRKQMGSVPARSPDLQKLLSHLRQSFCLSGQ